MLDLMAYAGHGRLPVGLIAFSDDQLCGIVALKSHSIRTHISVLGQRRAWCVPGFAAKVWERVCCALEDVARGFGYSTIYCGTATATGLLERNGWQRLDRVPYDGEYVSIYHKAL